MAAQIQPPEVPGLSPDEIAFIHEALAQAAAGRGWSARQEEDWQRKLAARRILRDYIDGRGDYAETCDSLLYRGELASRLYSTWAKANWSEPLDESRWIDSREFFVALRDAMNAAGTDTYAARCAEIGKRLVDDSLAYVLRVHESDGESVEDDEESEARAARRQRERDDE